MIEFQISDWAYDLGIRGAYACVEGLQPGAFRSDALALHFDKTVQEARERLADVNPAEHDVLRGFRELHVAVRADRKMISSSENLIRMLRCLARAGRSSKMECHGSFDAWRKACSISKT